MHHDDDHDRGLQHDLQAIHAQLNNHLARRRFTLGSLSALGTLGTATAAAGLGWLGRASAQPAAAGQPATCAVVPTETAGPFPGNGTGRFGGAAPNALALAGIVRSDIRPNLGGVPGQAQGVPLELTLDLVQAGAGCTPAAGVAVYLWQCDREGRYSLYSPGVREQNYLRGVQVADAAGRVRFTTVFPGCYPGRVPHLHFEVYRGLDAAGLATGRLKTSQLAFPLALCEQLYAQAPGYGDSRPNLQGLSLETDGIFRDGTELQLLQPQGQVASALRASLRVAV